MTTEGAAPAVVVEPEADDGRLFCYRHPDRETWVRCGRCDRPICPKCAMQGPVGFRCRSCGKPAVDPLRTIKPAHAVAGFLVAAGAGTLAALIGMQLGWFLIIVGFFAGGLTADLVMRITGFKIGATMAAILLGGLALGTAVAFAIVNWPVINGVLAVGADTEDGAAALAYLLERGAWALVFAGAAMAGAWGRIRI